MRQLIILCFSCVFVLIESVSFVHANTKFVIFDSHIPDRQARIAFAKRTRDAFAKLHFKIPTLLPMQREWLRKEVDDEFKRSGGRYTKRSLAAMESLEYSLRVAKIGTQKIQEILNEIIDSRNQSKEVAAWTTLSCLLLDYGYWQALDVLIREDVIEKEINGIDGRHFLNHSLWVKENVLAPIVLNYIQGKLPQ